MRGWIIVAIILVVGGYCFTQFSKMVKAKMDLSARVTHYLSLVDDQHIDSVKDDLIKDAANAGVDLQKDKIQIEYRDTTEEPYQQRVLGKVAEFQNKRVTIRADYQWRILGFGISQQVADTTIIQIQVRQKERPELKELLQ